MPECDLKTHIETAHSVGRHICDKCQNKFPFKLSEETQTHSSYNNKDCLWWMPKLFLA